MKNEAKPLVIRDEIHGDISFDWVLRPFVDHKYFQRLRLIRQLGLAEYVFPCASHSRFQHSLGAAHLGGRYFETMVRSWRSLDLKIDAGSEKSRFLIEKTLKCISEVSDHPTSFEYWTQVVGLSGMLHDIGHGPWSHTFEMLGLELDFSREIASLPGFLGSYFKDRKAKTFRHEDVSLLYLHQILKDLEQHGWCDNSDRFLFSVAALIHPRLFRESATACDELERSLKKNGIRGDREFFSLLGPIISGPFDVDRMDYIQRDGRNCGVSIGGIEWSRIIDKVVPCLADHPNLIHEPTDLVLLSNFRNQHVLDDFIFSLFQMYAQVYLHPKIVGLEESIRATIQEKRKRQSRPITFEEHTELTDDRFRQFLARDLGVPEVEDLLLRKQGSRFQVMAFPGDLRSEGFYSVQLDARAMMKDSIGVFLYSRVNKAHVLSPWTEVSPIAKEFYSVNYSPKIWLRPE